MGPFHDQVPAVEVIDESVAGSRGSLNMFEEEQIRLESALSEFTINDDDEYATDEGRLSRALQSWMPGHEYSSITPLEKPPMQPIYSGRLGEHKHLKRSSSEESIVTHLSLFTCSSGQESEVEVTSMIRKKKRKRKKGAEVKEEDPYPWGTLELAYRQKAGAFTSFMKAQNVMAMDTFTGLTTEESAIQTLMNSKEKAAMTRVGQTQGIRLNSELKKSGSMTNIVETTPLVPLTLIKDDRTRVGSAGAKPTSKPINLQELRQQRINEKLAQQNKQKIAKNKRMMALRKQSLANLSLVSMTSDVSSEFAPNTPSAHSLSPEPEERISVWKGDREILEMDLRKGLTDRASTRIQSTTAALERVTGFGDSNGFQRVVGRHEEFPLYVDDDYGLYPKIVQRIRISPNLSNVIKTDIKVRMGRPRYHEIRVRDLDMWNRGQKMGKGHTNLKVFNWLHSLREDHFEKDIESVVDDSVPTNLGDLGILHVESADEPDVKPLYMKKFW